MTVPLRDSDYAAIRARVIGEIHARRRRWRFAIAFATAAMIAFALWLRETPTPAPTVPPVPSPAVREKVAGGRMRAEPATEPAPTLTRPPATLSRKRERALPAEPIRIELHTHDPEIRIIWIVNATKEES